MASGLIILSGWREPATLGLLWVVVACGNPMLA